MGELHDGEVPRSATMLLVKVGKRIVGVAAVVVDALFDPEFLRCWINRGAPVHAVEFENVLDATSAALSRPAPMMRTAHTDNVEYLRVTVRSLRKKLEDDPSSPTLILNEPGVGYRFFEPRAAGSAEHAS
jgi:hypothetical protein